MIWKLLTGILFMLLVVSNLWHFYNAIDKGVTNGYREQELFEFANQLIAASKLCDLSVKGKPKGEVVTLLQMTFPDEEPFVKERAVNTTWLRVELDRQSKATTCHVGDEVEHWAKPLDERLY